MRLPALLLTACVALPGCDMLAPAAPAGVVSGIVTFNGEPAAGKRVSLDGTPAITDASGRYRFSDIAAGTYRVSFASSGDAPGVLPNEVAQWRSSPFSVGADGFASVPAFDVAYNGPLYPDVGMALIVSAESPVPFHWSTHRQAQRYRLLLRSKATGTTLLGAWVNEPTAVFQQAVTPGSYAWLVEIDAGNAGTGISRERAIDL